MSLSIGKYAENSLNGLMIHDSCRCSSPASCHQLVHRQVRWPDKITKGKSVMGTCKVKQTFLQAVPSSRCGRSSEAFYDWPMAMESIDWSERLLQTSTFRRLPLITYIRKENRTGQYHHRHSKAASMHGPRPHYSVWSTFIPGDRLRINEDFRPSRPTFSSVFWFLSH